MYIGASATRRAGAANVAAAALAQGVVNPYQAMLHGGTALTSTAARQYDVGQPAGQQAEHMLFGGAVLGERPVARLADFAVSVDMTVARGISALPPVDALRFAETVA